MNERRRVVDITFSILMVLVSVVIIFILDKFFWGMLVFLFGAAASYKEFFLILDKIFNSKLTFKEESSKENIYQTINVGGHFINHGEISNKIKDATKRERVNPNKDELLQKLREDVLKKAPNMDIISLIHKATAIANLKNDKRALEWLNHELYGYPENYKKLPEYRKDIVVRLNLGIQYKGGAKLLDLRKDDLHFQWGSGLFTFAKALNSKEDGDIKFTAPIIPELKSIILKSFDAAKHPDHRNFDFDKTPYLISKSQIEALESKVKQKIIKFVSED